MHAVANTPAESRGAHFALFPHDGSLPRFLGGSASALRLSRPAQRSLTLRPAYLPSHLHDPLHRRLQPLRCLRGCSDCYRLERPCRAGFAPAEKPCLRTAHQKSYAKRVPDNHYATDVSDAAWALLAPLLPAARPGGRRRTTNIRAVINAIFYLLRTGCQWRLLPREFPAWGTVYHYFRMWKNSGVWTCLQREI